MMGVRQAAQNTITYTDMVQIQGGSRLISEQPFHFFRFSYGPEFNAGAVELANKNVVRLASSSQQVFFTAWQMKQKGPPIRVATWIGNVSQLTSGQNIKVTV